MPPVDARRPPPPRVRLRRHPRDRAGSCAAVRPASRGLIERDFDERIDAAASGVAQELATRPTRSRPARRRSASTTPSSTRRTSSSSARRATSARSIPDALIGIRHFVPEEARARALDDLVLVTGDGDILGASDVGRVGDARRAPRRAHRAPAAAPSLRPWRRAGDGSALRARSNGVTVGLVGARRIAEILERIGRAYRLQLSVARARRPAPESDDDVAVRRLDVPERRAACRSSPRSRAPSSSAALGSSIAVASS